MKSWKHSSGLIVQMRLRRNATRVDNALGVSTQPSNRPTARSLEAEANEARPPPKKKPTTPPKRNLEGVLILRQLARMFASSYGEVMYKTHLEERVRKTQRHARSFQSEDVKDDQVEEEDQHDEDEEADEDEEPDHNADDQDDIEVLKLSSIQTTMTMSWSMPRSMLWSLWTPMPWEKEVKVRERIKDNEEQEKVVTEKRRDSRDYLAPSFDPYNPSRDSSPSSPGSDFSEGLDFNEFPELFASLPKSKQKIVRKAMEFKHRKQFPSADEELALETLRKEREEREQQESEVATASCSEVKAAVSG
eukprot:6458242-Amphidinium_carterae.3